MFAKCWNCQSIVNTTVLGISYDNSTGYLGYPSTLCPVCKFTDRKVTEEDWYVMSLDNDPENPQKNVSSSRIKSLAASKTIPWRKKRKYDWDLKKEIKIDESITDVTKVTATRTLYPKEYDDTLNTACDKVRKLKKAKTEAEDRASRGDQEPQWIVASSWTSAHF